MGFKTAQFLQLAVLINSGNKKLDYTLHRHVPTLSLLPSIQCPFISEIKNVWSYTSIPPHAFR
jgi:hypothetical protein